MYAAAGGASLASRQARRKENKKHHVISSDAVHQQFQRRFQQLHQEHARLYQTDINGRIPAHDIEGMTSTGMQAALYIREKKKQQRLRRGRRRFELPSHVATKEIAPFPPYPPNNWGKASAAWSERERRGSAGLEGYQVAHGRVKASDSHRKWTRRNRNSDVHVKFKQSEEVFHIHDSSYGGSSSEGEDEGAGGVGAAGRGAEQSAAANALLYVGLGTVAIGLVIAFVGTGEKGFKTLELRLIGPTLIFGGLLCCLLRILLCVCPSRCPFWGRKGGGGKRRPPDHDYYRHLPYRSRTANDFLLAEPPPPTVTNASRQGGGDKKRVSIVQTPGAVDRRPPRSSSTWRGGGGGGDPLHAGDSVELLELRSGCGVGGGGGPGGGAGGASASGADLHSASSEDSFNESLALVEASETRKPRDERLARLKSTLTFQDDVDDYDVCPGTSAASSAAMAAVATSTCPRIDEEREEEMTSSHSASPQPLPLPPPPAPLQPQPSTSFARRELVLSPAKLQNI